MSEQEGVTLIGVSELAETLKVIHKALEELLAIAKDHEARLDGLEGLAHRHYSYPIEKADQPL